ncbi:MAG: AAA-associated domain-containing protein [Candidatus Micrarchaeota archaeon]
MLTLPDVGISKVIGLMEVLHDHGNADETVRLAEELSLDVETLLPVIEAGEMLGFIEVASGKITLTDSGLKLINGKILERKEAIREKVAGLEPFKRVLELLRGKKSGKVQRKSLQKALRLELSKNQADKTLAKIIEWGRHADLIGYNSDSDELFLQQQL